MTGGNVGDGTRGLVDGGLASGECLGEGNSGARLLLAFAALLSLAVFAFVFSSTVGVGDSAAFALPFALAVDEELTAPPKGISSSSLPVGGPAGCTG